jgi:hypothetical protein
MAARAVGPILPSSRSIRSAPARALVSAILEHQAQRAREPTLPVASPGLSSAIRALRDWLRRLQGSGAGTNAGLVGPRGVGAVLLLHA